MQYMVGFAFLFGHSGGLEKKIKVLNYEIQYLKC